MARIHLAAVCAGALLIAVPSAHAQAPTAADIERKMQELRSRIPSQLEDAARRATVEPRRFDPARVPAAPSSADPGQIADQYRVAQREAARRSDGAAVMVFASFSMPAESLRRLARDASRAGVPIYFRGLRYGFGGGNTQRSLAELQPLVELGASVQIHPEAFETYGVRSVPAFVVATSAAGSCASPECAGGFGHVWGDVSLDYALQKLGDRRDEVGALARQTLQRIDPRGAR